MMSALWPSNDCFRPLHRLGNNQSPHLTMPRRNIPLRQPRPDKPKHAVKPRALGVMVVNLGSPRAPTTPAVKTFLAEFLSDSRVVPLPRLLWQLLLRAIILPIRSPRSAKKYQLVWRANPA
ncbi:MAG: ferrochelatase, partial [Alphaproteobacteria bacterium]|nr:ferrochelatase [Alphaproteobacteria bacterium]